MHGKIKLKQILYRRATQGNKIAINTNKSVYIERINEAK